MTILLSSEQIAFLKTAFGDTEGVQKGLNAQGATPAISADDVPGGKTLQAYFSNASVQKNIQSIIAAGISTTIPPVIPPTHDGSEVHPLYVDLYAGNNISDWNAMVTTGKIRAISHKASEGDSLHDAKIRSRWPVMKQYGLLRQAYLFYRLGKGVAPQWEVFQESISDLWNNDLPHELDLGEFDLPPSQQLWDESLGLLENMEKATGKIPWVYGAHGLLSQYQLPKEFARYGLSVADISHRPPVVPAPWTTFSGHQYAADLTTVPGCTDGADLNYFNGTLDQFKAL